MITFTCPANTLKDALTNAARLSEGMSVIQVQDDALLVSPCQEGAVVQRLATESITGRGAIELSPEILGRAANVVLAMTETRVRSMVQADRQDSEPRRGNRIG